MANFSHLCMRCMQPLAEGETLCPRCGDDAAAANPAHALPLGTLLSERYMVGRLLKDSGDAATYVGYDTVLKAPITLREFLPQTLCEREESLALRPIMGCERAFADYMNKFLAHARVVARMRDLPANIPMYDIFRENETAYTVSEVCEGVTLTEYLAGRGGRMTWDEARPLFIPLMNSLESLHRAGVLHLGIAPDVLIVGRDDKLHISDFALAEARTVGGDLTAELTPGYAAPEQYVSGVDCSTATDVYGVAAVIFHALVGSPPPDGETRPKNNADLTVPSEVASEFPPHVASALFGALQPSLDARLSSIAVLRDRLAEAPAVAALLIDEPDEEGAVVDEEEEYEDEPTGAPIALYIVIGVIACILLALLGFALGRITAPKPTESEETAATTKPSGVFVYTEEDDIPETGELASVVNLVGQDYYTLRGTEKGGRLVKLGGYVFSNQPVGTVIDQSPRADEEADVSKPIYVMVSAGTETPGVPNVVGWKAEHAEEYLKAIGYRVTIMNVKVNTVEEGCVVSADPPTGTPLVRGSSIMLRVNSTAENTTTTTGSTTTTTSGTTTTTTRPTTTTTTGSTTTTTTTGSGTTTTTTGSGTTTTTENVPPTTQDTTTTSTIPTTTTVEGEAPVTTTLPEDGTTTAATTTTEAPSA